MDVKIIKDKNIIKYFYPRVGGIMCITTKSKKFLTPIIQGYKKNIEVCDKKKRKAKFILGSLYGFNINIKIDILLYYI